MVCGQSKNCSYQTATRRSFIRYPNKAPLCSHTHSQDTPLRQPNRFRQSKLGNRDTVKHRNFHLNSNNDIKVDACSREYTFIRKQSDALPNHIHSPLRPYHKPNSKGQTTQCIRHFTANKDRRNPLLLWIKTSTITRSDDYARSCSISTL